MIAAQPTDSELWNQVLAEDTAAFEQVVVRHQSAVSAVSFSCIGDFAASEDIAQETFLVAWQSKNALQNGMRLRAWLCGIARNLAKNFVRRRTQQNSHNTGLAALSVDRVESDAEARAMLAEEQALIWNTLEAIHETYREPLVLFYRDGQSIATIADALDITEENAKQRLSRGRKMLRDSIALLIDQTLEQTRPGKQFTAGVMSSLGAGTLLKQSIAAASAGTTLAKAGGTAIASGASLGILGGLLGTAGGLVGAWLGTWIPAQMARTIEERTILERNGRTLMTWATGYCALLVVGCAASVILGKVLWVIPIVIVASLIFMVGNLLMTRRTNQQLRELQTTLGKEGGQPNMTAMRKRFAMEGRWIGRRYQSRSTLLGIPLLDIQFADVEWQFGSPRSADALTARGWLAIGDRAVGVIALGGIARGLVAVGGLALGGICFGGVSVGLLSFGGLALGALAVGGLGIGGLALGGGAIGYDAIGGLAIAWHSAFGGAAIANFASQGGYARAVEYAVGGGAFAHEANTEAARAVIEGLQTTRLVTILKPYFWTIYLTAALGILPAFASRWIYQQPTPTSRESQSAPEQSAP